MMPSKFKALLLGMTALSAASLQVNADSAAVHAAATVPAATVSTADEQASESVRFNTFLEDAFWESAKQSPQYLSQIRLLDAQGITEHNGRLDDTSPEAGERDYAMTLSQLHRVRAFDESKLSEKDVFNKKLFEYQLARSLKSAAYRLHNYPITQLYGWHNNFVNFMTTTHAVSSLQDAKYYVARLQAAGTQFEGIMAQLKLREEAGIIPPTFILEKVLTQLDGMKAASPAEHVLMTTLLPKLDGIEGLTEPERTGVIAETAQAIETVVVPAYAALEEYVKHLLTLSTNDAGAWKLPDGGSFYKTRLENFTTTDLTAQEVHDIGLAKVKEIQSAMLAILKEEGYDTSKPFSELINAFAEEDRHYYEDSLEGREQILADYDAMVKEIQAGVASQFNLLPKADVEVHRVPTYIEQGAPGGYYSRPAADGSRPGRFYANLYDIKGTPKYGMRALTYHEAVPGHHYQIALQQEQTDLPLFRKYGGYGAFVEGWALYAEQVAFDMGFQKTNFDKLGAYQSQLFRAVRLVVDTGMHAFKWTREDAITYMASNTGMAMSDVVTEIERYIVWPGQATGYMIGQLEILRMRAKAEKALGKKFDVKAFHDVVLKGGAVPLTLLEEQVDAYIKANK